MVRRACADHARVVGDQVRLVDPSGCSVCRPTLATAKEFTAVFPLVDRAKSFTARIKDPGFYAVGIVRTGRTVSFLIPSPTEYTFVDYLEVVGHYGSDQYRKATLDGVKAPMSY